LSFLLAVFLLVGVLGFIRFRADGYRYYRKEFNWIITYAMRAESPSAFSRNATHQQDPHKYYIPFYLNLLNSAKSITGDHHSGAFLFMFTSIFIYMFLMYKLTYHFCGDAWVGALIAAISLPTMQSFYGDSWGFVTPSGDFIMLAKTVFTAFSPLLFLAFFKWRHDLKVAIAFFLVGLLANVHPVSAYNIVQIFLLALLIDRSANSTLKQLALALLCFFLGALPFVLTYIKTLGGQPSWTYGEMMGYFSVRRPYAFLTPSRKTLTYFAYHSSFLVLFAGWGAYIGLKKRSRRVRLAILLLLCALGLSILGQGLMFQISKLQDQGLVNIAQVRAFRWIFPMLFLLASLSFVSFKRRPGLQSYGTVGLVVLLTLAPYGIPQIARDQVKKLLGIKQPIADDRKTFLALTQRVRAQVPDGCLFLINPEYGNFMGLTEKSSVVTYKEGIAANYLGPEFFRRWHERYQEVKEVYRDPTPERMLQAAKKYRADYVISDGLELPAPLAFREGRFNVYQITRECPGRGFSGP
jgi:hypothetical protein